MSIRVLLVEDHTMTRMGLHLVMEKVEDIELIDETDDGEKSVELAKQLNPDVILMDIGLPGIDGIEATKRIKDAKLDSKILIFTSRDNEDDIFAALGAGANAYIMKGANPDQLVSAIRAVSEGTAWLDPAIAKVVLRSITQPQKVQNPNIQISPKKAAMAAGLTEREIEVLGLIVEGLSNALIAERLFITRATAKAHVHSILQKLCVDDRTQAAVTAMREGLV
ncbi:MAG: hypothetical protein A2Y25_02005 [Candidatus Melainabacteria bacterium GWF2_37_15]|nr:MAG: hypothetical protein A2Y25_02005 [Candidatus Melainabacteria bacterium GWF2_37_15]